MAHTNPAIKKGDLIIITKSRNNSSTFENRILEVTSGNKTKAQKVNFTAKNNETNQSVTVYFTAPADEFIIASRENEIAYLKAQNEDLEVQAIENNRRIEFLEKYATEEDFVADKLDSILSAHSKGRSKKERVNAIAEVLKELKQSNIL